MSVDLQSTNGTDFSFSALGWAFYLNLAEICYDWEKAGTLQPIEWSSSEGPWEGAYDWNAGQLVTLDDASGLAAALEAYLADPEGVDVANALAQDLGKVVGAEITLHVDDRAFVERFVQFARQGEFRIW